MRISRILQAVTIMNRGGLETMLMNYYRNIDRTKIQFDFLVHRQEKGAYDDEIEEMGGRIYRMLPIHPMNFIEYKQRLDEFFKQHIEYKIVHAHLDALSSLILNIAKKHGVPVRIAHSHNTNYDFNLKAVVRECSKLFINNQCTHRFACSGKAGEWLFGKDYSGKITILNNAIEAEKFRFKEDIRQYYKEELKLQDKYVIGHIGRFNKQKNHKFIIDIFSEVYKKNHNARLLLVGTGGLEEEIRKQVQDLGIENAVEFLGVRADVANIMQVMDVFLFPSLYEGLPVTLIEAQAAGLRCIISDRISPEVNITSLIRSISLSQPALYWAQQILKCEHNYTKVDAFQQIVQGNYDIAINANLLEEFYLRQSRGFIC